MSSYLHFEALTAREHLKGVAQQVILDCGDATAQEQTITLLLPVSKHTIRATDVEAVETWHHCPLLSLAFSVAETPHIDD